MFFTLKNVERYVLLCREEEQEKAAKQKGRKVKKYAAIGAATVGGGVLLGEYRAAVGGDNRLCSPPCDSRAMIQLSLLRNALSVIADTQV